MKIWHAHSLTPGVWQNVGPQAGAGVSDLGFPGRHQQQTKQAGRWSTSVCSLKEPSLPLAKTPLRDFREKNLGAFHEVNQKNLAACYAGPTGMGI